MSIASHLNSIQSPSIAALLNSSKTGAAGQDDQDFREQLSLMLSGTDAAASGDAFWKNDAAQATEKRRTSDDLLKELLDKREARYESMRSSLFEQAMGADFGGQDTSGQGGTLASGLAAFFG